MFNETHHTFLPKTSEGQSCKGTGTYCNHLSLRRLPVILPTASGTFLPLKLSVASSLISPHHNLKGRGSYLRGQGRRRNLRQGKEKDRKRDREWESEWCTLTHEKRCHLFKRPPRSYYTFWIFAILLDHVLLVSGVTGAQAVIPQRKQRDVLDKGSEHFLGDGVDRASTDGIKMGISHLWLVYLQRCTL